MKKFLLIALVAFCSVSCELIGSIIDDIKDMIDQPTEIYLTFDESDESRVATNEDGKLVWSEGDKVSFFNRSNGNSCWALAEQAGYREGIFTKVQEYDGGEGLDYSVVLYPYNEQNTLFVSEQVVHATIPGVQKYVENGHDLDACLMVASGTGDSFALKDVCGRFSIYVTGSKRLVKISLACENGAQMAGKVAVNYADSSLSLIDEGLLSDAENVKEVVIETGEGIQLDEKNATRFCFILAQTIMPSSMILTMTFDDGTTSTQRIEKLSGLIIKLPVIGVVIPGVGNGNSDDNTGDDNTGDDNQGDDNPAGEVTADSKTIYYTTTDGNVIEPESMDFGANIISNTYENGIGKICFDDHVTKIGKDAFENIKTLETITLPISITSIGDSAFAGCDALTTAKIPNSVTELGYGIFDSCVSLVNVSLGNSIPTITRSMFYDCFKLTKIVIPDSVKTIEDFAFCECYRLVDVQFGSNVESIGDWTFDKNIRLESISLSHKLVSIGDGAFAGCKILQSVTMGDSVKSVGTQAFSGCEKLKEFNTSLATADKRGLIIDGELKGFAPADITEFAIPDNVTAIGAYVFYECKNLAGVTIPSSVRTILDLAFCMTGLNNVTIPHSVTTIGSSAFATCNSLASVTLENGVTTICEKAFYGCSKLTGISFPVSIESIQNSAFGSCSALNSVYCHSEIPPVAGNNIFNNNAAARKIYVHRTSVDDYKAASGWSKYADSIVGYDF